ncbi:MAG: type II secretion system protein [Oscillospiraceae bacterium]|nr:type II secretion system protein [Oscillospiraceae bacterium]
MKHRGNDFRRKKGLLRQKKGATLVELVVTFVLIAIFAVGTCQIVATSLKTYYQIRNVEHAQQVSDTILDKITGELSGAQNKYPGSNTQASVSIAQDGKTIEFQDKNFSEVSISTKNDLLLLHYKAGGHGQNGAFKDTDWTFDQAVYMDYTIASLTFTQPGNDYPRNIIQVDLTLEGPGGRYDHTRYVSCYNRPIIEQQTIT